MDEDGYIWYAGRADDVIISAGYRIGPFEVESVCIEHPAVREAAAVASPDERRGAVVKAFIVLAAGHEPSEALAAEISDFVRTALAVRVPAQGRVRRRSPENADRQDPPNRAAGARTAASWHAEQSGRMLAARRRPRRHGSKEAAVRNVSFTVNGVPMSSSSNRVSCSSTSCASGWG